MAKNSTLSPINSIVFISESRIETIEPNLVAKELVGDKAFGLSCLPSQWTLPFIVVSDIYLSNYRNANSIQRSSIIERLKDMVLSALSIIKIESGSNIIIRSSGCSEGLDERGKLHSVTGDIASLGETLHNGFDKLIKDRELDEYRIPLIIQKHIKLFSIKGHLSNERRVYEKARDWLASFDPSEKKREHVFSINLRNWRRKVDVESYLDCPLTCNLEAHIKKILSVPASWGTQQRLRIHFEWVWDGESIYLVQADEDCSSDGINPTKIYQDLERRRVVFNPECLRLATTDDGKKYNKIKNIFTYKSLGLPVADLYVLDDQEMIHKISLGEIPQPLFNDIKILVQNSLVIRMDIESEDLAKRQLLPRTQEERNVEEALKWLTERCLEIINNDDLTEDVAFIFHNFIPAISSAFAYASPGKRKVQIESLWGLPEGLYYNAHDKFIVDTNNSDLNKLDVSKFNIETDRHYKHYFVSPDESGNWVSTIVKRPYDWSSSIRDEEWIRKIALNTRMISERENRPVSVMWFIDVPDYICNERIFPWYHEEIDYEDTVNPHEFRYKTPFDQLLTVRTSADLEQLKQEADKDNSNVQYIKVQPSENDLLRNKETLSEIGSLAKEVDAVILLEGGVLSHAYYQLMRTHAVVEVLYPFRKSDNKREFNKLVRDKVPNHIFKGGETVNTATLKGESLLKALKDKLIEESYEVLDAVDEDSIVAELADVCEVIDGILSHLDIDKNDLSKIQGIKAQKAGGFKDGTVLLRTSNPLHIEKPNIEPLLLIEKDENGIDVDSPIIPYEQIHNLRVDKLKDQREHNNVVENKISLNIPLVRDSWTASSTEASVPGSKEKLLVKIRGSRDGAELKLQISLFSKDGGFKQMDLPGT